ncbi:MAG TPA: glycosyltransferase family 2 protein [Bryobacteraceae bacterium]|jgi:glycosyltransferase involved in cell wall biosynthesis|nr:glycosyltransferase family 2 protein [Bryobacteraceae bacterium]
MVSIVMPAHNEEEIIERSVREWYGEVASKLPNAELIVVNDCSTDKTGAILTGLELELPGMRHVALTRNVGHGGAVRSGLDRATQAFVFQTDSDRQHLPAEFWRLWETRLECDFVFGVRKHRADGAVRMVITNLMRLVNLALWGVWIRDANCPFKLMRRESLVKVLPRIPHDCFIPMVLVSILAHKGGYRTSEVSVTHLPRKGGTQSLKGVVKWARVGLKCARQLLGMRFSHYHRAQECEVGAE